MSRVNPLSDLFTGDLLLPYDPESGQGHLLPTDSPLLAKATADFTAISTPEQERYGQEVVLAAPHLLSDRPFVNRQRVALFTDRNESFAEVRSGLAALFEQIPKTSAMQEALGRMDEQLRSLGRLAALHVRRLHLLSHNDLQFNRLDSFVSAEASGLLIEHLLESYDQILIGSDSGYAIAELKAAFPGKLLALTDLMDLNRLTALQRALLGIVFLSRAERLFGPLSAYGVLAGTIGKAGFNDISVYLASRKLLTEERENLAHLLHHRKNHGLGQISLPAGSSPGKAAFLHRLACFRDPSDESLRLALQACVLRYAGHLTPTYRSGDHLLMFPPLLRIARQQKSPFLKEIEAVFSAFIAVPSHEEVREAFLVEEGEIFEQEAEQPVERIYLSLLRTILRADWLTRYQEVTEALTLYDSCLARMKRQELNPRGLLLKKAVLLQTLGQFNPALETYEEAITCDPGYGESYYRYARTLEYRNKPALAFAAFQKATSCEPYAAEYWLAAARLAEKQGHLDLAAEYNQNAEACKTDNLVPTLSRQMARSG
ncbi:hypothetical protein ACTL6U_10060 [Rhodovibrionaceae bacterium A322]